MADIFDTITEKRDVFDAVSPKRDVFDMVGPPAPLKTFFQGLPAQPGQFQGPPPPRPLTEEFKDATARGTANVGSGLSQGVAGLLSLPTPGSPYARATRKANQQAIIKAKSDAALLWNISKDPSIAAQNKDLSSKAVNLIGETIPYITGTTAAYLAAGPMGSFTVGSLVEGNSAYRTALDDGVPEAKAKKIGVGVGIVSGAIESFGGRGTEMLLNKATAKLKSKVARGVAIFGTGTIVEALEEAGQEVAAITGEETYRDVDWKERVDRTLSAAAGGAFLGGMFRATTMAKRGGTGAIDKVTEKIQKKIDPPTLSERIAVDLTKDLSPAGKIRLREMQKKAQQREQAEAVEQVVKKIEEVRKPVKAVEGGVKQPWEMSDLATAPNIPIGNVKAEKQVGGKWKLMFRGTRNEVFQGELFNSAKEARSFFSAQKAKAQNALGVDKENAFIGVNTVLKENLLKQFYQLGVIPEDVRDSYEKLKESFTKEEAEDFKPVTGILDKRIAHEAIAPTPAKAKAEIKKVEEVVPKTPVMKQWKAFKDKYPDTVLLVRMGDFYESFGEDAKILRKELGLTLTKRGDVPMAGLPYHSIDPYLKRLIQAGHKVALVEPVAKGTPDEVKRDIVRVTDKGITPIAEPKPFLKGPKFSGGVDPITTIMRAIRKAKKLTPEVKEKQHKELGKRVAKAARKMETAPGGNEGAIFASTGELKGPLTEYQLFESVRKYLNPEIIDNAFGAIRTNKSLTFFGVLDTSRAFQKLIDGYALTLRDAALLERQFGSKWGTDFKNRVPLGDKAWHTFIEVLNIPRTLLASFDQSGILRQGRALGQVHPKEWAKMVKRYNSAFWRQSNAEKLQKEIEADPFYEEAVKDGMLEQVQWGTGTIEAMERSERFIGAGILEKIPYFGVPIRASERSFATALNYFRMAVYSKIRTEQSKQKKRPLLAERRAIASRLNDLTGRSHIKRSAATRSLAPIMNAMFSPRFSISRVKPYLSLPADVYKSMRDGKFREELKLNAGAMSSMIATNLAIMFLLKMADDEDEFKMDWDLRASDGGKIRVGDSRFDLWAGYLQPAQLMIRLASGQRKSANGKIYDVEAKRLLYDFGRSKANPIVGFVVDAYTGSTFYGGKFLGPPKGVAGKEMTDMGVPKWVQGVSKEAWNRMVPLVIQDTIDALELEGIPMAVTAGTLAFYGGGIQTYPPYKRKRKITRRR